MLDGLLVLATTSHGARADEPIELAALTRHVAGSLAQAAARARVRFEIDAEPACVRGDPALLERLVANLLENAIRHAPGCRAGVRVRDGVTASVEVASGGAVIAPALLARLGEPFQRLDRGRSDRGSGLGLSIVRAVAEAHGGGLELAAPAGGGLRVRVTLPAAGAGLGAGRTAPRRLPPRDGPLRSVAITPAGDDQEQRVHHVNRTHRP